jgi:CubicO group peptidase (beta-lactamase class C family)
MTTTIDAATAERVRAAAAQAVEQHHIPGLSIGIVAGDDLVFSESFGYADIETKEPMTPERRQRIASITKTMVGLCAMAAVDDGKLRLDDRLDALLPGIAFTGPAAAVTLRHLLTHTSGIGEAVTRERLLDVANPDRQAVDRPGDFDALYPDGVVIEAVPGSKWAYCNNGYAMVGEIIARAEGEPLADVMQRRIFGPLGMTSTDIDDVNDARITSCYHRAPNEDNRFQLERAGVVIKDEPTVDGHNIRGGFTAEFNQGMRAAGGVQSNIPDMARYASALLRGGRTSGGDHIVRTETFAAMTSPQHGHDPRLTQWGLSFALVPLPVAGQSPGSWRTLFGHGGAYFGGWNSHIDVSPRDNIAVVQHMNVMMDEPGPAFRKVLRAVFGVEQHAWSARDTDPAILDSAPGIYELPMPGPLTNFRPQTRVGRVQIERHGDGLILRSRWGGWKNGAKLTPCDDADPAFFAAGRTDGDWSYVAMDRDPAGRVTALRFDDLVRMPKRPD